MPMQRQTRATLSRLVLGFMMGWATVRCAAGDGRAPAFVESTPNHVPLTIPRIERAPRLEEFVDMQPGDAWKDKLAVVKGFIQRAPDDGRPATQPSEAYLGYDSRALHIVFIAHDGEPRQVRARLDHRESIAPDEDQVGIYIDTFRDRRRAYRFECNPLGVQDDAIYSEDSDSTDEGFDTVWTSRGQITAGGYVVLMSIPFRSLRFSHERSQTWNIALWRNLGRRSEVSWWPRVSSQHRGFLSQASSIAGIEDISPGRNLQFDPYVSTRSFHVVDGSDPHRRAWIGRSEALGGLDAKAILKDSLVLDLTIRPDFSQVESDQPQITTNQRYELFYPEKRPFFTENSSYFDVPMVVPSQHLLFTRRIAEPDFGVRLTGKLGRYSIGALFADDRSAGEAVPQSDPVSGKRAFFGVVRFSRDLPSHSNVGASYAEREFAGAYSRVVDVDTTLGVGLTWKATVMAAYNWNKKLDGSDFSGSTVDATLTRVSRGFNYIGYFLNRSPGFQPAMSFYDHSNWREVGQTFAYQFWPNNPWITRIWTEVYGARNWHYDGIKNWEGVTPTVRVEVKHNTTVSAYVWEWHDVFSHVDFAQLNHVTNFPLVPAYGLAIQSTQPRLFSVKLSTEWGTRSNVSPPAGQAPVQARYRQAEADLTLLTSRGLTVTNTYLFDHNANLLNGSSIYNSHIVRSNWGWQINRALSLRFIAQYSAVLVNPLFTATATARGLNEDFLVTYLVHPGTAVYVGYNSNLSKPGPAIGSHDPDRFVNDGRQFFVKVAYLFRL